MIKLGEKSENGPNTRQKVFTKCMWLLGTCRNAIVVVATGALGFWFVAAYDESPVRLMGQYPPCAPVLYLTNMRRSLMEFSLFMLTSRV